MTDRENRSAEAGSGQPVADAELARRLDRLSRALDVERQERAAAERPPSSSGKDYALAFRLASEFVAGVLVGAALGWTLDWFAGTSPWGLIVLLLLGFCAGVLNVMRVAGKMTTSAGTDGERL